MCPMGLDSKIDHQRASRGGHPQAKSKGRCAGEVCGSTKRVARPQNYQNTTRKGQRRSLIGWTTTGHGMKCSSNAQAQRGAALHGVLLEKTWDWGALVARTRAKEMVLQWSRQRKSIPCIRCAGWHQSPASTASTEGRAATSGSPEGRV